MMLHLWWSKRLEEAVAADGLWSELGRGRIFRRATLGKGNGAGLGASYGHSVSGRQLLHGANSPCARFTRSPTHYW